MPNLNKVLLLGHLTRDVELRHTQAGGAFAKFGMAINRTWTQNGEKKESVCFVDLTAWGKTGEIIAEHCKKGSTLLVEGRLDYQSWEDKEGKKRNKLDVIVENFQFIGGKDERVIGGDADEPKKPQKRASKAAEDLADRETGPDYSGIPF